MTREKFKSIRNFSVYYGPSNLPGLATYDCVIIEPSRFTDTDIAALRLRGTLVIGYVTAMEVGPVHHPQWSQLAESDFLHNGGERIAKESYNTYLLDLTSNRWRALLHQEVGRLLTQRGFDGIFLDTIGDVEDYNLPNSSIQIEAAAKIIYEFRRFFPRAIIIQNNGLEALCLQSAPYIDAITWENPPVDLKNSRTWVRLIAERLNSITKQHDVKVMTLFDRSESLTRHEWIVRRRFTDANGYLTYFAPTHYLSLR